MKKCRRYKDGTIIPGCMGVAAAFGCGLSDAQIMAYCTCRARHDRADSLDSLKADLQAVMSEMRDIKRRLDL